MRKSHLALCGIVLAALWFVKWQLTGKRPAPLPSNSMPTTNEPLRAGAARAWLLEEYGEVQPTALRREGT